MKLMDAAKFYSEARFIALNPFVTKEELGTFTKISSH